ncbi:valine--tRNA ligase [Candidatus Woesearchaeota archaeon CG10_big_fil_rev_8_21_14_0_10_44_13]|nr:MAG: valine--tRNA ligase [Candidatus Woesearchaeota archaeon CG10_big_fil_rev_8_21_14_0_10_44_13]
MAEAQQKQENQNYDPLKEELKIESFWEKEKIYKFDPLSKKKIFSIDTPPPTVSGKMHIGHAFSYSQQDFIARYKRMRGFNVFYPFGTDDNGLATIRLVESMKKVKGTMMGRDEFINLTLEVLSEVRPKYISDWKRIGTSADFSIYYTTIDNHCRKISQKSFIDIYKAGREYRKEAPTLWCPECQTAIAQVEMEDREFESFFNDIVFKLEDGSDLIIATTRPELLPACVAIFAHPDDKRYRKLFGKKAKVPLFNHEVPILPDEKADPEKGTGAVMCCTFGDQTDMEWYYKHKLPLKVAITKDGRMNELAPGYEEKTIKEARKAIIEDLKNHKLLLSQTPIKHAVNVHERCGTPVEILQTNQWFIRYLDLRDKFMEAGNRLNWYPDHMKNRYDNWIKGLQWDWCISRQRHFGIPIPVWYCSKCGEVILPDESQLPVDPVKDKPKKKCKCGSSEFEPESDVLDTWATSSLSPQIAASLFPDMYDKLYPMDLRPQAHDIITFWLFNTLVKSQMQNNINPWKDVMISGWALDPHGKKMSKSKGNVVEPQAVIAKYGADCLRFWASGSKLGEDLPYQEKDLVTGKKMITKLWNASKFAMMHIADYRCRKMDLKSIRPIDLWVLTKFNNIVKECTEYFDGYEYSKTKAEAEKFFWQILCDNYLEIIKDRIYNPARYSKEDIESAKFTLYTSLLGVLKLMAPIMPYITESIYHLHFAKLEGVKSIHVSKWPEPDPGLIDGKAEKAGDLLVDILAVVRKEKSAKQVSLKTPVKLTIDIKAEDRKLLEIVLDDLKAASNAQEITFGKASMKCANSYVNVDVEIIKEAKNG